jgi:hypothetical protein
MNSIYQQQAMETDHAVMSVGNEIEAVATLVAWLSYKSSSNRVEAHKLQKTTEQHNNHEGEL